MNRHRLKAWELAAWTFGYLLFWLAETMQRAIGAVRRWRRRYAP